METRFDCYEMILENDKSIKAILKTNLLTEEKRNLISRGEMLYIDHNSSATVIKSMKLLENEEPINCTILDIQDMYVGKASRIFNYCYYYDKNTVVIALEDGLNVRVNCTDEKRIKKHIKSLRFFGNEDKTLVIPSKQIKRVKGKECCECALIEDSLISRDRANLNETLTELLSRAQGGDISNLIDLAVITEPEDTVYLLNIVKEKISLGQINFTKIKDFSETKIENILGEVNILHSRVSDNDIKEALRVYYKAILKGYLLIINKERKGVPSLDFFIKVVDNLDTCTVYKLQAISLDSSFAVFEYNSIKNVDGDMVRLEKALEKLEDYKEDYIKSLKFLGEKYLSILKSIKDGTFNSAEQFLKSLALSKISTFDYNGVLTWAEELDLNNLDIDNVDMRVINLARMGLITLITVLGETKTIRLQELKEILEVKVIEGFLEPYRHKNTLDTFEDIINNCDKFNDIELKKLAKYFKDYKDYNLNGMNKVEIKDRVVPLIRKLSSLPSRVTNHESEFASILRGAIINCFDPPVNRDYNKEIMEILGMSLQEVKEPMIKSFIEGNKQLLLRLLDRNKYSIIDSSDLARLCAEVSNNLSKHIEKHDDISGTIVLSKLLVNLTNLVNTRVAYSFGRAKGGRPVVIGAFK